jgi:hypothetical protein
VDFNVMALTLGGGARIVALIEGRVDYNETSADSVAA